MICHTSVNPKENRKLLLTSKKITFQSKKCQVEESFIMIRESINQSYLCTQVQIHRGYREQRLQDLSKDNSTIIVKDLNLEKYRHIKDLNNTVIFYVIYVIRLATVQ